MNSEYDFTVEINKCFSNYFPITQERFNIQIGIITVPSYAAQEVADRMVNAGIKAIWNFASVHLNIPSNIALKNEDLASSLALLSLQIQQNRNE